MLRRKTASETAAADVGLAATFPSKEVQEKLDAAAAKPQTSKPLDLSLLDDAESFANALYCAVEQQAPNLVPYVNDFRNAASNLKSALLARANAGLPPLAKAANS